MPSSTPPMTAAEMTAAIRRANPALSRFDPLDRIVYHADFGQGHCGFTATIGNYEGSLDTILADMNFLSPQLSGYQMWDTGSGGSMHGGYSLKLATRPVSGSVSAATKRLSIRSQGVVRLETYFGIKSEATEMVLTENDVRAFGVLFDIQDDSRRLLPRLRYLNAQNGESVGQWQIKTHHPQRHDIGATGKTASIGHYAPVGYTAVPGGRQQLCHNELPTKMNWHYLSVTFDLASMRFVQFRCNDRVFDQEIPAPFELAPWPNLRGLLNTIFFVETDVDKRAFLYLDSVLFSSAE